MIKVENDGRGGFSIDMDSDTKKSLMKRFTESEYTDVNSFFSMILSKELENKLSDKDLLELLKSSSIVKNGHFKLTSGRHSDIYCNKDLINPDPLLRHTVVGSLTIMTQKILDKISAPKYQSEVIITGPAVAGAIWALPVANKLMTSFIYPEKNQLMVDGKIIDIMEFRRGYDKFLKDRFVIIIEDIITTGKSVNLTADAVGKHGGIVQAVVAIWNRTGKTFDFPSFALIDERVDDWKKEDCPMCKEKIPLIDPKTGLIIKT